MEKGYDYVAYNDVLAEADFYGLEELTDWIKECRYLKAVETSFRMEIYPGQFNVQGFEPGNYRFLHMVLNDNVVRGYHFAEQCVHKEHTIEMGDLDLVSCFEIKVPSEGNFKCPQGINFHYSPEFSEDCLPPGWDEEEGVNLEHEVLPSSIVTVTRSRNFRPEACIKDYEIGRSQWTIGISASAVDDFLSNITSRGC
jgi:hypothetical protein